MIIWWRAHCPIWKSCVKHTDEDLEIMRQIEDEFGDGHSHWNPVANDDLPHWVFLFAVRFECICYQELFFTTTVTVVGLVRAR